LQEAFQERGKLDDNAQGGNGFSAHQNTQDRFRTLELPELQHAAQTVDNSNFYSIISMWVE
jgi:hypothetical protein